MANTVGYFSEYLKMVDRIYKESSVTGLLEANASKYKMSGVDAKTVYLQDLTLVGLGDYSKSSGYSTSGDVTLGWTAYSFAMDRARKFYFDATDVREAGITAAQLAAEFYRIHVIPEIDAYRFEKLCTLCGLDVSADLTYDTAITAIDTGIAALDQTCSRLSRAMFVSANMYKLMKQSGREICCLAQ